MKLALLLLAATALQGQYALWIDLSGDWRIQEGDRPEYAAPDFDDSRWNTIQLPQTVQRPANGFWLRKRVQLPAGAIREELALTLGVPALTIYEVYCNGRRIGQNGTFGDFRTARIPRPLTFLIPPDALPANGEVQLAVRVSRRITYPPSWSLPDRGPYLLTSRAQAPTDAGAYQLNARHTRSGSNLLLAGGWLTAGLLALTLWLIYPKRRDVLWLGLHLMVRGTLAPYAIASLVWDMPQFNQDGVPSLQVIGQLLAWPFLASSVLSLAGNQRWPWHLAVWAGWCVLPLTVAVNLPARPAIYFADSWCSGVAVAVLLRHWIRQRAFSREDHFLFTLLLVYLVYRAYDTLLRFATGVGAGLVVQVGPYALNLADLLLLFVVVLILAMLLRGIALDRRKQQRLEDELAAARTVQQLLIPAAAVPGVEAVYEPAQEVGGDFYQIRELADGSLLVVTGDISGKGLKAAMMVSLLVGAVKNRKSDEPSAILSELNKVAVESLGGGFATAIVARIFPDGSMRVANAGHLAPYHGGVELIVESGLPLGIDPTSTYDETAHHLQGSVTFLSDGVVEATNPTGELFGFDRTAAISTKPAKEIAAAAKAWGQNDDITVVTVRRLS